jgi:hypothetical protein
MSTLCQLPLPSSLISMNSTGSLVPGAAAMAQSGTPARWRRHDRTRDGRLR